MTGLTRERVLSRVTEETLALAGTSPTGAAVGAGLAYLGARLSNGTAA
ncbi:hypothetical protein [Halomarina litorea]|nr:hypothetical protein [Halomarina sp. BCD28]